MQSQPGVGLEAALLTRGHNSILAKFKQANCGAAECEIHTITRQSVPLVPVLPGCGPSNLPSCYQAAL